DREIGLWRRVGRTFGCARDDRGGQPCSPHGQPARPPIQSSITLVPVGSTFLMASGGILLKSVACTRFGSTPAPESPGFTIAAFVTPRSPRVGATLQVFVCPSGVVKRRSICAAVGPSGRWQNEQFEWRYERARGSAGPVPSGAGSAAIFGSSAAKMPMCPSV